MSSETITRKKRSVSDAAAALDGDHRKRRRNRTTQSCLNCHTSKRMCDRKRPACARCTQLGLTGLCVYEVDDPSQRSDSQDENSRLLKRVAELEGVIRELKNKPHPRWVQAGSNGEEYDKWHTRAQARAGSNAPTDQMSPNGTSSTRPSPSDKTEHGNQTAVTDRPPKGQNVYPPSVAHQSPPSHSSYSGVSPQSTPSPSAMTPTEEYSRPQVAIAGQTEMTQEYDLTSMFLTYSSLMGCDDSPYGNLAKDAQSHDSCFIKPQSGHCGCLYEASSYNVVLELSLRLRKAADVLARSASHHMGANCLLNKRVADLDTFATNALGNIATPPEELSTPLSTKDRSQLTTPGNMAHPAHGYNSAFCRQLPKTTISPQSLHGMRSWELMPPVSSPPVSCDDSFMPWEPPRRA